MTLLVVSFWLAMLVGGLYIGVAEWLQQADRNVTRMLEDER